MRAYYTAAFCRDQRPQTAPQRPLAAQTAMRCTPCCMTGSTGFVLAKAEASHMCTSMSLLNCMRSFAGNGGLWSALQRCDDCAWTSVQQACSHPQVSWQGWTCRVRFPCGSQLSCSHRLGQSSHALCHSASCLLAAGDQGRALTCPGICIEPQLMAIPE